MKIKIQKAKRFVAKHPIISVFITWFVISLVISVKSGATSYGVGMIVTAIIFSLLAPFIRAERRKIEIDYLAKKIAEEQRNNK